MINREDMLELTRRMTPARTSFTRIAGCYVDADGDFDGSFNINFLKLSASEKTKNLAIAKTIPFAETNTKLKKYEIQPENQKTGSMWQLLMALRDCELKNDALMDTLYDIIMENIRITTPYAIYVFHDNYDIPAKAAGKERLGESEETEHTHDMLLIGLTDSCRSRIGIQIIFFLTQSKSALRNIQNIHLGIFLICTKTYTHEIG